MPPDPVPPPRERPNQRWTPAEENALKIGIAKHGFGKWQAIISDPDPNVGPMLAARTNVDLKDKWRNMRPKDRKSGGKRRRPSGPPTVCDPSLFQMQPVTQLPIGYMQGGAGPTLQQFSGGDDPRLLGYGSLSAPGPPSLAAYGGGGALHSQPLAGSLSPTSLLQQQLAQQQLAQQQGGYGLASGPAAAGLPGGAGGSFGGLSLQREGSYGLPGHHQQQRGDYSGAAPQGGFQSYGSSGGGGLGSEMPHGLPYSQQQQQQLLQQQLQQQQQQQYGLQGGLGLQQAPSGFQGLGPGGQLGLQGGLAGWHGGTSSLPATAASMLFGTALSSSRPPGNSPFGGSPLPASAAAAELQLGLQQQGGAGPLLQGGGVSPSMPAVAHLSLMSPMVRAHSAPEPEQSPLSGDGARQAALSAGGGGSATTSPTMQGGLGLQPGASLPSRLPSRPQYGVGVAEGGRQRSSNLAREQLSITGRSRSQQLTTGRLPLLHEACAAVDVAAVVAALPMAASIGEATPDGRTALHALAAGVQGPMQASPGRAIAAALVQTGLQVNAKDAAGATPLHLAASPAAVEILLAVGASPQDTNNAGETPLFAATERGAVGVVNALVARDGRLAIDLQTDCGETALIRACSRGELAQIGLLLLQAGASVSPRDAAGRQALHAAAEAGILALVVQLLAAGADARSTDASGDTPIMLALRGTHSAVVALLNAHLGGGGGGGGGGH